MKTRPVVLTVVMAAAIAWPQKSLRAGEKPLAPDWELKTPAGQSVRLSDYKGKAVVLNFWATWCMPCLQEIPDLIALQKAFGPETLAVIGVSLDTGSVEPVTACAKRLGINYPVVLADGATVAHYGGVEYVPTTFIIDRTGRIAAVHTARTDFKTLEAEIKSLQ